MTQHGQNGGSTHVFFRTPLPLPTLGLCRAREGGYAFGGMSGVGVDHSAKLTIENKDVILMVPKFALLVAVASDIDGLRQSSC